MRKLNLPLTYEVADSFDEERFLKLRVKVMHSGLNLNNSNFNSSVIEKAQPTLANIPLLAFVKKTDGTDDQDFAGHEFEIKITENDFKYVYLGRPIGIVPETNNYAVEVDEEGRQFVVVDAYVWKNYANSALDIVTRDGIKKVSMEVIVNDYSWEDSYIDILDYSYIGITMLGEDVKEAMIGAKAEVIKFSKNTISDMLMELKEAMKGGTETMTEEEKDLLEQQQEEEKNTEEMTASIEEEEDKPDVEEKEEEKEKEDFEETEEKEEETENFEQEAEEKEEKEDLTFEQQTEELRVEKLKNEIETLKQENKRLQDFVDSVQVKAKEEAIEALFAKFNDLAELEEIKSLKELALEMNLEDLETKLFALRGKNFTQETKEEEKKDWRKMLYNFQERNEDGSNKPEWADIVEKYRK